MLPLSSPSSPCRLPAAALEDTPIEIGRSRERELVQSGALLAEAGSISRGIGWRGEKRVVGCLG